MEAIKGANSEHTYENMLPLYSQLYALRKHAPNGLTWQSDPLELARRWDTVVAPCLISEGSQMLVNVLPESRLEITSWLVSALCVCWNYTNSCSEVPQ